MSEIDGKKYDAQTKVYTLNCEKTVKMKRKAHKKMFIKLKLPPIILSHPDEML